MGERTEMYYMPQLSPMPAAVTVELSQGSLRETGGDLDLAIDERRLRRVAAAAEILWHDLAKAGDDMRIDVILLAPGRAPRHLANVWCGQQHRHWGVRVRPAGLAGLASLGPCSTS